MSVDDDDDDVKELKELLSWLRSILSVHPSKLRNVADLAKDLISVFGFCRLRRERHGDKVQKSGHDHSLESDICSIFACLAVSRDHDLDDEEKLKSCPCEMVKLRSEDARKMIQQLVMHEDHLDDVEAVI